MKRVAILLLIISAASSAHAKVDLVTLPSRDTVQLTIYNSADMTLVRESRALTLKTGGNKLQFSWANTLIDPTSLEMLPKANADKIDIAELVYPPRVRNLGLWNVQSDVAGKVPVEISYLTSGLSWRAFYMGTLTEDEKTMRLKGYVRVTNNSGEDYENAQTRLIVGKVHILDEIAELARRQYPYGRPGQIVLSDESRARGEKDAKIMLGRTLAYGRLSSSMTRKPKEVIKEGLSEYFLYTIEGTETIPTGWSKRLLSFDVDQVPVVNLYKYEEQRYGPSVVRFLSFKNDKKHKLLGTVANVVVEPKLMDYKTEKYKFDRRDNVSGWDEIRTFQIEVRNTRDINVKVEIKRNFNTQYWDIDNSGDFGAFEKVNLNTVKFTLDLQPRSAKKFEYVLRTYHGVREEDWRPNSDYCRDFLCQSRSGNITLAGYGPAYHLQFGGYDISS